MEAQSVGQRSSQSTTKLFCTSAFASNCKCFFFSFWVAKYHQKPKKDRIGVKGSHQCHFSIVSILNVAQSLNHRNWGDLLYVYVMI